MILLWLVLLLLIKTRIGENCKKPVNIYLGRYVKILHISKDTFETDDWGRKPEEV